MSSVLLNRQQTNPFADIKGSTSSIRLPPGKAEIEAAAEKGSTQLIDVVGLVVSYRRDRLKQKVGVAAVKDLFSLDTLVSVSQDAGMPQDLRDHVSAYLKSLPGYAAGSPIAAETKSKHEANAVRIFKSLRSGKSMLDIIKGK